MWRVGSSISGAARKSSDDEEAGSRACEGSVINDNGLGVMVCGGALVYDDDEAGAPAPAAEEFVPATRRAGSVGSEQRFYNLPTLPARRAMLRGQQTLVDNSKEVGTCHEVVGSHFGVGNAHSPPAPTLVAQTFSTSADLISDNKPVQSKQRHEAMLNKLAGLEDEQREPGSIQSHGHKTKEWCAPYTPPKAPGSNERGKVVLAPASLTSPKPRADSQASSRPSSCASSQDDTEDGEGSSRPTSDSFCSSCGSEDGSESSEYSSEDDAAGVGGLSLGGAASRPGRRPENKFCLGIRWFIRNNKLVVGSFSGWSVADKMGVKHGDILRAVDGVDVLNMVADEHGNHPAKEMLKGNYGSKCALSLMRVDLSQVKEMMGRQGAAAGKEKLVLHDVQVVVPRLIADDV